MPVWGWWWVYQVENEAQNVRASWIDPNRPGNVGWYLTVLNAASEYGLSFDTCGRECERSTCRSASRSATFFEVSDFLRGHRGAPIGVHDLRDAMYGEHAGDEVLGQH